MARRLGSGKLVIATHNAGKLKEIAALMAPHGLDCISAGSLGLPEPVETGRTFVDNALIKARAAAEASGMAALADDSGLSVAALDGRPGVYTADWAERQWFEGEPGRDVTFAELTPDEKHAISHRADAFAKLVADQFG